LFDRQIIKTKMLIFLKLGGSLITDKSRPETARQDTIKRLAQEIKLALDDRPRLQLMVGHGSGSFGHVAANRYHTHLGVEGPDAWRGFAKVSVVAARLNQIVLEELDSAGVPVFRVQPSASAICEGGRLIDLATKPIERALQEGLVPLVHGDVSIDMVQGGTIISTETIFSYLAGKLSPTYILLAGDFEGVWDHNQRVIRHITPDNFKQVQSALGDSAETDVTGGMAAKVSSMMALSESVPGLRVHIFSGKVAGNVQQALSQEICAFGTLIYSD
jgi:isopentenyl phosphate kinase